MSVLSEREAFEVWYCADAASCGLTFMPAEIAKLREGDTYGPKRVAINSKWEGWQARASINPGGPEALARIEALEAEIERLKGADPYKADLWWNPSNDEAGFTHFSDAFEDANEDGGDWSVELHRGRKLPPVWGAIIDGYIRLFSTEAEAEAARSALNEGG